MYALGTVTDIAGNSGAHLATYWKNGEVVFTENNHQLFINDIFVENNNVHIVGSVERRAKYWKNGQEVAVQLRDRKESYYYSTFNSIFIHNRDVYIAGVETNETGYYVVKYWKNGQPISLTQGMETSRATSIFVDEGDVYVSGGERFGHEVWIPKYWKNGVPVALSDGSGEESATSVFVDKGDVYVAGYESHHDRSSSSVKTVAKYWKNGVPVNLMNGVITGGDNQSYGRTYSSLGISVFVDDGNVYVGGEVRDGDFPHYWINNSLVRLQGGKATSNVCVYRGDVYIAGNDDTGKTVYWKNGQMKTLILPSGSDAGKVRSVFVARSLGDN